MFWYFVFIIIFVYIANKITLKYGFVNVSYTMTIDKNTYEINEPIEITSTVENKKPMTVSFLKIIERFPHGFNRLENRHTLFIMPNQRVKRTYRLKVNKRGLYHIDETILELGDFIGFDTDKRISKVNKDIIVFPERIELDNVLESIGSLNGNISVKRWILEDPLMTIGIREYTGNEPERYIHWPSVAKYNNLMVKNFDFTTDNSVMVVLNLETTKPKWQDPEVKLIERSISIVRAIVEELEESKIQYGFTTNFIDNERDNKRSYLFHPNLGTNHLDNILCTLGRIDYRIPPFFEKTLNEINRIKGNYSTVVIVTSRILETYIEPINYLSKTVNRVVVISLEDDLDLLNSNIIKYRGVK